MKKIVSAKGVVMGGVSGLPAGTKFEEFNIKVINFSKDPEKPPPTVHARLLLHCKSGSGSGNDGKDLRHL